jgi:hypothetical protein
VSETFPAHTIETAPDEVRPVMEAMQQRMGFIPSMLAKFAEAPPLGIAVLRRQCSPVHLTWMV